MCSIVNSFYSILNLSITFINRKYIGSEFDAMEVFMWLCDLFVLFVVIMLQQCCCINNVTIYVITTITRTSTSKDSITKMFGKLTAISRIRQS